MKTLDDVHKICLTLLDEFIRVCNKHNLQWFADSGTLLGAIRKGEIIPWDDDIDIIMPRNDYNKLLKIADKEFKPPFFFQSPLSDTTFNVSCKLRYDNTTILENDKYTRNQYDYHYHKGIFIDIFVFDSVPENDDIFTTEEYFLRYIYNFSDAKNYGRKNYEMSFDAKELFKIMTTMLTKTTNDNSDSKYVANLFFNRSHKYMHFKISRAAYSSYSEIEFKGLNHKLRIPCGYEEILTLWYGTDWRIEKHINDSHGLGSAFHDTKVSYKEYEKLSYDNYKNLFTFK